MTHHLTSNKQKEAESKRKPPSEPICCTTTGRSAANSLAKTIGAASSSTQEAQVESTVSPPPPCVSDEANQKAPQASQLRLARRRPEFFGQAHERRDLVQLPCSPRSDVAHAALNGAAAQAPVAHELVKEQAFNKLLLPRDQNHWERRFSRNTCFRGSKVLGILSGALTIAKGKFSSVTRTSTTQSTNHLPSPHSVPCIARASGEVGDVVLRPAAGRWRRARFL